MKVKSSRKPKIGFVFAFILTIAGIGMLAGSLAILAQFAQARIELNRESDGRQHGSLSFIIGGVPIFWRSLDGLAKVERRDYQVSEKDRTSGPSVSKTVGRVVFLNDQGDVIIWGERGALLNEREHVARYLESDDPAFTFTEEVRARTWRSVRDSIFAIIFIVMLLLGGILCTLGGVGGMWTAVARKFRPKQSPSAVQN